MDLELYPDEARLRLGPLAQVLRGYALEAATELLEGIEAVERAAPFRHMVVPGGRSMSVAMTNCGRLGWVADRRGYRYESVDPETGRHWPPMPTVFARLASEAAAAAGFPSFMPDACLINRYLPGTQLSLHQDKDEEDFGAPIVSVSLGMEAVFLWGGMRRGDRCARVKLRHGDIVVWGGEDRLRYHGVAPLGDAPNALLGSRRINLTFRKAG